MVNMRGEGWCVVTLLNVVSCITLDTKGLDLMHKRLAYGNQWHRGVLGQTLRDGRNVQRHRELGQTDSSYEVSGGSNNDPENSALTKTESNASKAVRRKKKIRFVKAKKRQAIKRTAKRILKRKLKISRNSVENTDILPEINPQNNSIVENLNR